MLKRNICNFVGIATISALVFGAFPVCDAYADGARSALNNVARVRGAANDSASSRQSATTTSARTTVSRTAVGTPGRVSARGLITSNAMRGASNVARSAARSVTGVRSVSESTDVARSAMPTNVSRANPVRATAVFSDVSKIGGGYAQCREAYATCMDQFCANANDTYRRCYCSSRFTEFHDTEEALDQAKTLLMQFEDNNLNAVDKTAAEVDAMYSATVGEAAIKNDTSGAAKILDQIGDLLSGKKKANKESSTNSLGLLSLDISSDVDDIWGGTDTTDSIFGSGSGPNLAELEGVKLYNASNNQCTSMISDACESNAVLQMARSSYSIMITQDCNAYAKKIDSKREAVKQTVRTAEKYLREARLEEYRSHNSADVNECMAKVKAALQVDTACGSNYKRCLDYTGAYINQATGEPIYSPRLFELTNVITLDSATTTNGRANGVDDVLVQNDAFNRFLDTKRIFATSALDTCRDIADTVWTEFKRSALIEIAQAQDEKIEEVKMSCVNTMAECYDRQSSALKDFDTTTAKTAGAVSAYAASAMCKDKVIACAALYSANPSACKFDGNGKFVGTEQCGLTELLDFVDTVDTTRVAEACGVAVKKYLESLCTPTSGGDPYPWNCRLRKFGNMNIAATGGNANQSIWNYNPSGASTLVQMIVNYTFENCASKSENNSYTPSSLSQSIKTEIELALADVYNGIATIMGPKCEAAKGIWVEADVTPNGLTNGDAVESFYTVNFLKGYKNTVADYGVDDWGKCVANSVRTNCEAVNISTGNLGYAQYDETSKSCAFTTDYYKYQCEQIDAIWEDNVCYVKNQ